VLMTQQPRPVLWGPPDFTSAPPPGWGIPDFTSGPPGVRTPHFMLASREWGHHPSPWECCPHRGPHYCLHPLQGASLNFFMIWIIVGLLNTKWFEELQKK
jgi:hypothetical protein